MPLTLEQGLLILQGRGPILDVAREISHVLREHGIEGAIIGGVAVGLHGRLRATEDVDVFVADEAQRLADALRGVGYTFDAERREFSKGGVPVHLVTASHIGPRRPRFEDINGIRTVSLADLINIKLRSGRDNLSRARDLADVVDLARERRLTGEFTANIDPDLRADFRKVIEALRAEAARPNGLGP
jgi:hypothetical protein